MIWLMSVNMQLFKYFDFAQSTSMLSTAINRSTHDLIGFGLMFFVIFLAFAQFGSLVFGNYMRDFSTFGDSLCVHTAPFKHHRNYCFLVKTPVGL